MRIMLISSMIFLTSVQSEASNYEPRKGHWHLLINLVSENGEADEFLISKASYPATCTASIQDWAEKTEKSNGHVWTGFDDQLISFSKTDLATEKKEVVGIGCKFIPWTK